jgi:beta-galactosidase
VKLQLHVRTLCAVCLLLPVMQQALQAQSAAVTTPSIMLGTAWYPEQWPEARWEEDLTLMQQAHLHVVRVGEFA